MIRTLFILITLGISSAAFGQAVTNAKHIERLRKFRSDYCESLRNKSVATLDQYVSESARLMPEFQKTIMGKENVMKYWTAYTARFDVETCTRTETEILDLGGRLFETGVLAMKMKLRSNGKTFELNGKYVDLWDTTGDRIQLLTSAWNYDHAIDFHDELRFADVPYVDVALAQHAPVKDPISFELAGLNRLMEATIMQHDAGIWKQFYTDDASFLYSNTKPIQGRKAIDEFIAEHVKQLPVFEKLDVRNDRIDDLGKYVIEYASHIAIVRNGDWSGVFTGKDLAIWRREPNGSLKIFRHLATYD